MYNKNNYTRSERNAVIVLLIILILLMLFKQPIILKITSNDKKIKADSTRYFALIEQIENAEKANYKNKTITSYSYNYNKSDKIFTVDINTADAQEFEKLYGIGKVYSERIVKYRNKIGGFSSIEQLKEVYGIHDTVYQKFKHQLRISFSNKSTMSASANNIKIEVNSASVEELIQLKGIGSVYAKRIVEFRDKLGGFYAIEQLKDVYGIHDTVYQKLATQIYIKPSSIKKININKATLEELISNPYFFSTLAKQVVGYRTKVKPFENVEDLKKLYYIKDHPEYYNKILPYVTLE